MEATDPFGAGADLPPEGDDPFAGVNEEDFGGSGPDEPTLPADPGGDTPPIDEGQAPEPERTPDAENLISGEPGPTPSGNAALDALREQAGDGSPQVGEQQPAAEVAAPPAPQPEPEAPPEPPEPQPVAPPAEPPQEPPAPPAVAEPPAPEPEAGSLPDPDAAAEGTSSLSRITDDAEVDRALDEAEAEQPAVTEPKVAEQRSAAPDTPAPFTGDAEDDEGGKTERRPYVVFVFVKEAKDGVQWGEVKRRVSARNNDHARRLAYKMMGQEKIRLFVLPQSKHQPVTIEPQPVVARQRLKIG